MAYLEVANPRRPHKFGSTSGSRLVYRVVLDDNKLITLPDLCRKLNLPYSSLFARIKGLNVGKHDEPFWTIVSDVRKRVHNSRLKMQRCSHCQGKGWIHKDPPAEPASV